MKRKNYIFTLFIFHCSVYILQTACTSSGLVSLPYGTEQYCAKCDTTCKTCSNQGMNNCIVCPDDFVYNENTSYCIPPNTKQIKTLQSSYKFVGFSQVLGWDGGIPYTDPNYGPTVYKLRSDRTQFYTVFKLTPAHYKLRILVSVWFLDPAAISGDSVTIQFYNAANLYKTESVSNLDLLGVSTASGYRIYPAGWRAKNIDVQFPDRYNDDAKIVFKASKANFGIRQFIFIQYLCNQTACSRCDGPTNTSCLQCVANQKREITAAYPKQCLCNSAINYFKHPDFDYCVNPCPNRIDGQYYGDSVTKSCVLTCTDASHYADPVTGICQTTCSVSISLGSVNRALYYDTTNKKCVTICPDTQPYSNSADKKCYATCPGSWFKNDRNMECVANCPDTQLIPLFGQGDQCVEECVGADNWADFNTHKCTATCSNDASGNRYFQDNSTKRNLCVRVCPFPQYFGDYITNTTEPYCDQICPNGTFGDYLYPRHCVTQCSQDTVNSINYFGLKINGRECVKLCPQGMWGQTTDHTCLLTQTQCKLDGNKYADNHTWICVAKGACSRGRYTLDSTTSCVITCPSGTYADDATRHCQLVCAGSYFADPGINKCVQICHTQDLYSDVSSGNKCVPECLQTGVTLFRDPTTKKCVDICPIDKKIFADSTAKSCVYNCTPGTYAYDAPPDNNKTCVSICTGLYFADNSTQYGICRLRCPQDPPLFGDIVAGKRLCVIVCQAGMYGDQNPLGGRLCTSTCPSGWFAQNDHLRRCVRRCNSTTYGQIMVCKSPANCAANWVGDPSTNLCVSQCPASQGTFSDFNSHLCVKKCPILGVVKYFADPTLRRCETTCNAGLNLFGNNNTLTCQSKCIDSGSYADAQHENRFCIQTCTNVGAIYYYRNNFTKTCVISTGCPDKYFADNSTETCVAKCPIISSIQQTWGHIGTQTCVIQCYGDLWGDTSTGIPLCIPRCPSVPMKWSYNGDMTCVTVCPSPFYGQDSQRKCQPRCQNTSDPGITIQTFAYDDNRRCLKDCPQGTFGDYTTGKCYPTPNLCTFGWGDDYNNSCVSLCTGPTPWDTFGDSTTHLCTIFCSQGVYADSYTGSRKCVPTCPGAYDSFGNVTGAYDTFGDNQTNRCQTNCMTPGYFADWQTHRCQPRCSGDGAIQQPTYANNANKRCAIALACPISPDKLYGDNRTRLCDTKCFFDTSTIQWADNLTRTCIPQCYHISSTAAYPYDTRFYGDISTGIPVCVIKCPQSPRLFGQNITNKCVPQCPDNRYGDQVNNRSCTSDCYQWNGVIYYSQITKRLCVAYCQKNTFANWHNRHCQTVPTDCPPGEYGNNGNNSCISLCPQYMNYFGDPSTKLCVKKCPDITVPVLNATAGINEPIGHTYADYSTRLCVRTCPANYGLQGTFGDNFTATCVQRCPINSYGDPQTLNRHCVQVCTGQNFADPLTMLCVDRCPASPPFFGHKDTWTCVKQCPTSKWADQSTRLCVSICPATTYRLTSFRRQCVNVCPSNPDLYADTDSGNCQFICTLGKYADPTDRVCKASCLPDMFQYNFRCLALCPDGYYANLAGNCVLPASCDTAAPFSQNRTTKCVSTCSGGSFADPNSHYCIAVCPDGWYGDDSVCRQNCLTVGTSASIITQTCVSSCPNLTYHQNNECRNVCQIGYANDQLGSCHSSCPLTPIKLFANPLNHDCVQTCPSAYVRDHGTGFCVLQINGCSGGQFSDQITGNCVTKCSLEYWGNTLNHNCLASCVDGQYGYQSSTQRTCYLPLSIPASAPVQLYADPQSREFIPICHTTPKLYFADTVLRLCVQTCVSHTATAFYGDPQSRKCESSCKNTSFYTADGLKNKCVIKCTIGTFRYNNTGSPQCRLICPQGYADSSTRVCVGQCPVHADTYGFHNQATSQRICVNPCPVNFYADPTTRQCNPTCQPPFFADNLTHRCVDYCINSFADKNNDICMDKCYSNTFPSADNSTNQCVLKCPSQPDYYNQNHVCVLYCTQLGYFADPQTRQCVSRCQNVTGANPYFSYGDPMTGRCVKKCPEGFWGDNSTNKCVATCVIDSYADNDTRLCVAHCPINQSIYADPLLHICAYTCSGGYFGSQVSQECIPTCDSGATQTQKYWGNPLTTLCVRVCPSSIYSYGQNITRKCVLSCNPHAQLGFADNFSRICRQKCQSTLTPQTFADPTTSACVQICPQGYYAQNTTQQCLLVCLTGYADNYSRYCVAKCPDDPESYGDTNANGHKLCVYQCQGGRFSNNDTNLCDTKCSALPDFYGDSHLGRCVYFCTEGTYAQNFTRQCLPTCPLASYADNLTRKCVQKCPAATQGTYRDTLSNKCVRICPDLWYAENSSNICVNNCPKYPNGTQTYEDVVSMFCVAQCPSPYYGKNDTHQCVLECSASKSLFGHQQARVCVTITDCFPVGPNIYYADDVSGTCVQTCPQNRWADDNGFKCVTDCDNVNSVNKLQLRNLNNQKCVILCPSDPAEYADDISGNCVGKCPDGSYAYSEVGYRRCISVAGCKSYGLFADNSTNRCVSVCPADPFMYADFNTGKCVYYCADSLQFASNKTQTCVVTCPSDWQLFGSRLTYTCVQLCPDGYFADELVNRQCVQKCHSLTFADKWTSTCVQHCSLIRQHYYEDTSTGTGICVEICPGDSYGYNPDQTCKYKNMDLSSSCIGLYYADRASKRCVKKCPINTFADGTTKYCQAKCAGFTFADKVTRSCKTQCSDNYFALVVDATSNICVQFCPSPYFAQNQTIKSCVPFCSVLFALQTTRSCQSYCPEPYFKFLPQLQCRLNCAPAFADRALRKCLPQCTSPNFGNPLTFTCDLLCPLGYYGRPGTQICSQTCAQGTFSDPSTRLCVTECPQYPLLFADDDTNQCVQVCQNGFGYQVNRTCLASCPNTTVNSQNVIYLADGSNNLCVLHCIKQQISFADYMNNQCTQRCPSNTYANNFTKQCMSQCPTVPHYTFAENTSHICMQQCPPGTFGSSQNLHCVSDCWWPNFQDQTTRLCLQICPDTYFAQNQTAICTKNCQANTYADPTTKRCVAECPLMHDLFKYDEHWKCVSNCPVTFYADPVQRKCKIFCALPGMYAYQLTRECVRECPVPYRAYDQNHTCILSCPYLYFYNVTRNKCTKCPVQCLVCTTPTSCITCASGYNLFNGMCDISCQPSNGIITYSNPQGICVRICPFLWYGDNSSYACTQNCPLKTYGSNQTQLCQNCPQTCAACSSLIKCTVCQSLATLAIDNMCYKDCNSTHKYYYNITCYNNCPNGTYLTYNNVQCGACSTNCLTCTQTSTKCLSCLGKYYYDYICLVQCPKSYFGNKQFICQQCTNETKKDCQTPLNFTTKVIVQDYKYVILLKFNQNVDIEKQIQQILKIKLKVQRRLLQLANLINNGISYTYVILADGTIKLTLIINQNLAQPEFTVQFLDPTAIKSKDGGGTLQNSQSNIFIQKIQYYTAQQGIKAQTNIGARFAVIFILILYAISFFWTDAAIKPLQMIQLAAFHATLSVNVPPSLFYYLLEFKSAIFQFMPNLFIGNLQKDRSYHDSSQKVIDTFVDYDFLRNVGQIFFFLFVFGSFWLLFLFLSNKRLISNKIWHNMFQEVFKRRFKFTAINDVFSLFYVPTLWFGFSQFKDLMGKSQPNGWYMGLNAAFTIIFLIIAITVPVAWFLMWLGYQNHRLQIECAFMCRRVKKLQLDFQIHQQQPRMKSVKSGQSQQQLDQSQLKSQKHPKSHIQTKLCSCFSQKHNNPTSHLQTLTNYVYLTVLTILLVSLDTSTPTIQLALLLATNLLYIAHLMYVRPYVNIINTVVTPLMMTPLIFIQGYMVYFYLNSDIQSEQKSQTAKPLLIVLTALYVIMVLWTVWRVVYDAMDSINYFKKTQFYLTYGDPEHTVQGQISETYQKFQRKAQHLQNYQPGDTIIQRIYNHVNQNGQSIIKVKKKVLRKKRINQQQRRVTQQQRRVKGQQKYRQPDQNSSQPQQNHQMLRNQQSILSQCESQEQFVRVNKPTPFQMSRIIDQEIMSTQNHLKLPTTNFKAIDDDIRDQGSEDNNQEYQLKKSQKRKLKMKTKGINENSFINHFEGQSSKNINKNETLRKDINEKVIVQVQDQESQVHQVGDVVGMNGNRPSTWGYPEQGSQLIPYVDDQQQLEGNQGQKEEQQVSPDNRYLNAEINLSPLSLAEGQAHQNRTRPALNNHNQQKIDQINDQYDQQFQELQQPQNMSTLEGQSRQANVDRREANVERMSELQCDQTSNNQKDNDAFTLLNLDELLQYEQHNKNNKLAFLFEQDHQHDAQ